MLNAQIAVDNQQERQSSSTSATAIEMKLEAHTIDSRRQQFVNHRKIRMWNHTVEQHLHANATCAAGIIVTTVVQKCGCIKALGAGRLLATTAATLSTIQRNHSVEIARRNSSTHGEPVEQTVQDQELFMETRTL